MRQQITCLMGALLCAAFPQPGASQDARKDPASKPVELNEKAQRGLQVLREMKAPAAGLAETERYARQSGPLGLHARDSLEFGYGQNWDNDDSLSRREKHLILIAAFITMERGHELEAHLKFALDNGVKLEDYEPMLALLTPFIGLPAASNAAGKMHCLMVADANRPTWCPPAAKAAQ
jgi:alkylhydroperoxidase/carboxymuconolactone decarboxylase family protein YurZ